MNWTEAVTSFASDEDTMDYFINVSASASLRDSAEGFDESRKVYEQTRFYCDRVLIPIVLFIGIIGNTVTIVMLRKKQLQHSCSKTGKRVTSGLLCLAASDMAFCVIGFLSVFVPPSSGIIISDGRIWDVVALYYTNYKGPLLNTFLLTSTWLIISISVARYDAISEPFQPCDTRRDKLIKLAIFILAICINIPQFFQYKTLIHPCNAGRTCYYRQPGPMYRLVWYHILWHLVGTVLPLFILVYCNCRLLREIYRNLHGSPYHGNHSTSRIAVILVGIITLFLVLVCPSMILTFLAEISPITADSTLYPFRTAITVTNLLQSVNFAVNFVLYTAVSKEFRLMLIKILNCKDTRRGGSSKRQELITPRQNQNCRLQDQQDPEDPDNPKNNHELQDL